ncbi:MAG: type IV pilus twitching motility protein PilT [Peptococcaceae bacterium]|nr:type IV pilus twitching motility protein PilT [Peptococcaceae bacterium]
MSGTAFAINELLRQANLERASDLHLTVELPPMLRIDGELVPMPGLPILTPADTKSILEEVLNEAQFAEYTRQGSVDFARSLPGIGRFRVNAYRQRYAAALALRLIPVGVPSLDGLGMPKIIGELARKHSGLVIVTGPTGSGKSTTLAAMIAQINREESLHILTLEDPIEFLHRHNKSMVNQREIGPDTPSFAYGLRAALREDPDVILVGEMRDYDTTQIAISAAETGHLVLTTLHTPSASQTIDRIIDIFPPQQQSQIRIQLAASLQGVIAQQLLPRADGPGRVAAVEILVATPAVRNLIREGKTHQLPSILQTNARLGMITMEASLRTLLQQNIISPAAYEVYSQEFSLMKILE